METMLNLLRPNSAKIMNIKSIIVLLTLLFSRTLIAQNGTLKGVVVGQDFGDGLFGVNVFIEGTTRGVATDINGEYSTPDVEPGKYIVTFSMIGFQKQKITGVEIKEGESGKIDVVLRTETYETEEVIVSAKAMTNTEASLLAKRQKSVAVSDAISAEEISKSGSGDAASAMKKVTGASVVGGKYVYIRGLGERYSSTMLNGAASRPLEPNEIKKLGEEFSTVEMSFLIARDALSVYINPENKVRNLTIEQVSKIFKCEIKNWEELGGKNAPIQPMTRSSASGTFLYFTKHVLKGESICRLIPVANTTTEITKFVKRNKNSIGYGGIGSADLSMQCNINEIEPTRENVFNNSYPISRYLRFYTSGKPKGNVKRFID